MRAAFEDGASVGYRRGEQRAEVPVVLVIDQVAPLKESTIGLMSFPITEPFGIFSVTGCSQLNGNH